MFGPDELRFIASTVFAALLLAVVIGVGWLIFQFYRMSKTVTVVSKSTANLNLLAELGPVVFAIARQFRNDHGTTLLDQLQDMHRTIERIELDNLKLTNKVDNLRAEQTQQAYPRPPASATYGGLAVHGGTVNVARDMGGGDMTQADANQEQIINARVELKLLEQKLRESELIREAMLRQRGREDAKEIAARDTELLRVKVALAARSAADADGLPRIELADVPPVKFSDLPKDTLDAMSKATDAATPDKVNVIAIVRAENAEGKA